MKVNIVLDPGAFMPESAHAEDAGYDLRTPVDFYLRGEHAAVIDTGVHMVIPEGYAGVVIAKSGLNVNYDITSTGLVDAGYTGSIRVKLYNHGRLDKKFKAGDKISQIMLVPILKPELVQMESEELPDTDRGAGGFGSTGR